MSYTVNVVIFAGGKFRENVGKTLSLGGNFDENTPISFINAYWFYFRMGWFLRKRQKRKKRENFHVYSNSFNSRLSMFFHCCRGYNFSNCFNISDLWHS